MITLITGTPGAGKTALAVAMMLEEQGKRPFFVSGITDLKIDHQLTPPVEEWTQEVPSPEDPSFKKSVFTFPPNSIIVIDEAQTIYRPRASSSKVPPHVAAFETHRHTGVDFWLITQDPAFIDSNVRRLVGRHVHLRSTALGRYLYEWSEVGDPDTKSSRQVAASRRYKLPKKVFSLYKSATVHIRRSSRLPLAFYILLAVLAVALFLGYRFSSRLEQVTDSSKSPPAAPSSSSSSPSSLPEKGQQSVSQYVAQYVPRISSLAHTAPAYDDLTKPSRVPVPSACIASSSRCRCYTQDATPYQVDESLCRQIAAGGIFLAFDSGGHSNENRSERAGGGEARDAPGPQAKGSLIASPY